MRKLFVVGDSISIQYGPHLERMLEGIFEYDRKGGVNEASKIGANGGDSSMVLAYLRDKLNESGFAPDFLMLNCGLHDIKTDPHTKKKQVSQEEYRQNLEEIVQIVRSRVISIIWVRTTPVDDDIHNTGVTKFERFNEDVIRYNEIADSIFASSNCPIIDLYNFTLKMGDDIYCDHVHFTEQVREMQASFIAGYLYAIIISPGGPK